MSTENLAHRPPDVADEEIPVLDVRAGMWVYDRARDGYLAVAIARLDPWHLDMVRLTFRKRRGDRDHQAWAVPVTKTLQVRRPS